MFTDPSGEFYTQLDIQRLEERVKELEENQLMLIKRKKLKDAIHELELQGEQAYKKGQMKYQCGIQKALEILKDNLGEYL